MSPLPAMTLSKTAADFIDDRHIGSLLQAPAPAAAQVREIIAKSLEKQALSVAETAALLRAESPELVEEIFAAARELKQRVYGNRIVLFAPLYIGNHCVNACRYCGFSRDNHEAVRRTLTPRELVEQVIALEEKGHKRLILVFGEHPQYDAAFIAECVRTVYDTRQGHGEIRRVNINAAPLDHEGYRSSRRLTTTRPTAACTRPTPARATSSTASTASAAPWRPAATTSASAPWSA